MGEQDPAAWFAAFGEAATSSEDGKRITIHGLPLGMDLDGPPKPHPLVPEAWRYRRIPAQMIARWIDRRFPATAPAMRERAIQAICDRVDADHGLEPRDWSTITIPPRSEPRRAREGHLTEGDVEAALAAWARVEATLTDDST